MTFTQAQEEYLKKIADIGVAEEADIAARTAIINAEVEQKNIDAGIIDIVPVNEETLVVDPTA